MSNLDKRAKIDASAATIEGSSNSISTPNGARAVNSGALSGSYDILLLAFMYAGRLGTVRQNFEAIKDMTPKLIEEAKAALEAFKEGVGYGDR